MPGSRAAAIDAGSNTILLLAGETDPAGPAGYRVVRDEIEFARLGEGIDVSKRLSDAAMARGLAAFRRYAGICKELGITRVKATGTSALRDATNGAEFLAAVERETGYRIEIIDGVREAKLGFAAATDELAEGAAAVVLDIGGGSMQLIRGDARRGVRGAVSFDLGAVRLTERWLKHDPPLVGELAALQAEVATALQARAPAADGAPDVYGVSGTCTTLAAVALGLVAYDSARIHGASLTMDEIAGLQERFLQTDSAGRAKMPGLHPKRADVIVAGTAVLQEVLAHYGRKHLRISDRGIRHAVLRETLQGA